MTFIQLITYLLFYLHSSYFSYSQTSVCLSTETSSINFLLDHLEATHDFLIAKTHCSFVRTVYTAYRYKYQV